MSTVRKSTFMSNAAAITAENFTLAKLWVSLFGRNSKSEAAACCRRRNLQTQLLPSFLRVATAAVGTVLFFSLSVSSTSYRTTLIQLDSMRATSASLARTPSGGSVGGGANSNSTQQDKCGHGLRKEQTSKRTRASERSAAVKQTQSAKCCCKCFACSH